MEKDEDGEQFGVAKLNLSKDRGRAYRRYVRSTRIASKNTLTDPQVQMVIKFHLRDIVTCSLRFCIGVSYGLRGHHLVDPLKFSEVTPNCDPLNLGGHRTKSSGVHDCSPCRFLIHETRYLDS